jgi:hypothetical protein
MVKTNKLKTYFVSYIYRNTTERGNGFGQLLIDLEEKINKYTYSNSMDSIEEEIKKEYPNTSNIVILNFIDITK